MFEELQTSVLVQCFSGKVLAKSGKVCSLLQPQLQVAGPPGCTLEPDHFKILSTAGTTAHHQLPTPSTLLTSITQNNNYLSANNSHQLPAMVLQSYDVSLNDGDNVSPYAGDYAPSALLANANYYPELDATNLYHHHHHHHHHQQQQQQQQNHHHHQQG